MPRASRGRTEPIGNRIIEVPEDEEAVVYRDPIAGFVAYVPRGSIAKREAPVKTGGGKTTPCTMCHATTTLKGLGDWPALAGRHPNYIVRQLWNTQNGERIGPSAELMRPVVRSSPTTTCWPSPPTPLRSRRDPLHHRTSAYSSYE